jgi:hypothetical protein
MLRVIMHWTTDNTSHNIFWFKGRDGDGKSTIALTIAQSLNEQGLTSANFFLIRGGGDFARSQKTLYISSVVTKYHHNATFETKLPNKVPHFHSHRV